MVYYTCPSGVKYGWPTLAQEVRKGGITFSFHGIRGNMVPILGTRKIHEVFTFPCYDSSQQQVTEQNHLCCFVAQADIAPRMGT